MVKAKVGISGQISIESRPKKSAQGTGKHSKYSATSRNKAKKRYRGQGRQMKCWHCDTELIWGGDNDCRETTEDYSFVTNLHCPRCDSYVEVYYPKQDRGCWQ